MVRLLRILQIAEIAEILKLETVEGVSDRELIYSAYKLYYDWKKFNTQDQEGKPRRPRAAYDGKALDKVIVDGSFKSVYTEFQRMGLLNEDDGYEQGSYAPRSKTNRF